MKEPGSARFVCVSRIDAVKNQLFAMRLLRDLPGASLDLYGPPQEPYWSECRKEIGGNIFYRGALDHGQVIPTIAEYDFFILPTLGENFGHVIIEALSAGVPVIISDRTSFGSLTEHNAGFAIPIEQQTAWNKILQWCIDCDLETYRQMAADAFRFANSFRSDPKMKTATLALFDSVKPS